MQGTSSYSPVEAEEENTFKQNEFYFFHRRMKNKCVCSAMLNTCQLPKQSTEEQSDFGFDIRYGLPIHVYDFLLRSELMWFLNLLIFATTVKLEQD